jgi:hypothetical protein
MVGGMVSIPRVSEWKVDDKDRRRYGSNKIDQECTIGILTHKCEMEYCAVVSWPTYASQEEDMSLRCKEKWMQYINSRPIMWDMMNVPEYQFTDSDL